MAVNELYYYQTAAGKRPFVEWLEGLTDRQARARIEARLARAAEPPLVTSETPSLRERA